MKIESITLREIRMPLRAPFETSFGVTKDRRIILAEVRAGGATGWGEVTAGEGPFYNPETTDTCWSVLCDFLVPLCLGKEVKGATDLATLFAPVRGHEMAKAAIENAAWDAEAQIADKPLWRLLGGTQSEIPCGVSIGLQASAEFLLGKVEQELRAGYQRIKIKIKPGRDIELVEAIRKVYPKLKLMVDANSAYTLEDADRLRRLDDYYLMMIEQPLHWDDIHEHAKLQALLKTPVCLDESIHNARHAATAIELRACGIINIKLGRVGGHTEAKKVEQVCRENSVPVWCGGMLEAGIGRAHNIAMSTLPGFVLPGDVSASKRYWEEDIIEPEVTVSAQGSIQLPETPGLGFAVRRDRIEKLTVRSQSWQSD